MVDKITKLYKIRLDTLNDSNFFRKVKSAIGSAYMQVSEAPEDAAPEADAEVSEAPEDATPEEDAAPEAEIMQGDLAVAEVTQVAEETEDIRGLTDNVENIILRNGSALEIDDCVLILYSYIMK